MNRRQAERRGRWAEAVAVALLLAKGYWPLARRVRLPVGEIDLIVRRGRTLVFVEVKARAHRHQAVEALSHRQQKRIARAAALYIARNQGLAGLNQRFDLVVVTPGGWPRHISAAWMA